jgi:hypothetical protein
VTSPAVYFAVTGTWPPVDSVTEPQGHVTFQPLGEVAANGQIGAQLPITVPVFNGVLAACSLLYLPGIQYVVTSQVLGSPPARYVITPTGAAIDLSTVPRAPVQAGVVGLTGPQGPAGATGAVGPTGPAGPALLSIPNALQLGWSAWTGDPALMNSNFTPVVQTLYVARAYVDQAVTCTHAYTSCVVAGVTVSGAYIGVYNAAGTLLQQTADISSSLTTVQGVPVALPILSGLTVNQLIYLVLLINSAGTMPQFAGTRANGGNLGITGVTPRIQVNNTGVYSTLPSTLPALKLPSSGTWPCLGIGA